jgi:hypothetical protein
MAKTGVKILLYPTLTEYRNSSALWKLPGLSQYLYGLLTCNCFLFVVYSVFFIVLWHRIALCYCFSCVFYCSLFLYCTVSGCVVRAATLAEVFPCFFLSCKANARVINAKTEHGLHFPNYIFLLLCMFNFVIVMYVPFCVFCVLYCCHRVSTQEHIDEGEYGAWLVEQ